MVRVVHQRLNTRVFADVATLADNVRRVTEHLAGPLRLYLAGDGGPVAVDGDGAVWRTLTYLDGTASSPRFDSPAEARAAASAAARLVADLADLPGPPLPEVIAGFHDVRRRLADLDRAASLDPAGRVVACRPEIDAVRAVAGVADTVAVARADGRLPGRTVHNDAKADNVLFDAASGAAVALVDLDTVGPGTVLFDVGDLVRSGASTGPDDAGPDAVGVRHDVVDAVLTTYAEAGNEFLTAAEVALLPLAGPLMTLEAAARFLTDHLEGDTYYPVDRPGHNLLRARTQLRLLHLLS